MAGDTGEKVAINGSESAAAILDPPLVPAGAGLAGESARVDPSILAAARVCPRCAAVAQVAGDYCPHCGQPYMAAVANSGISRRVKVALVGLLALLVLGGAGAAIAIKLHHDSQVAAQHRRAVAAAQARQAAAAQAQQQQQAQQAAETTQRQTMETSLQNAITKDAQQSVDNGVLTGPILSTSCTPLSGGSSESLSSASGTYTCLAVNKLNPDGTSSGYHYSGTIDFTTGTSTWRLGGNN
jgi:type II secretory pathway pseudopilin PulG